MYTGGADWVVMGPSECAWTPESTEDISHEWFMSLAFALA